MNRKRSGLQLVVAAALLLAFVYALFTIGADVQNALGMHEGQIASVRAAALQFLYDNKVIVTLTVLALFVAKLVGREPGAVRSGDRYN